MQLWSECGSGGSHPRVRSDGWCILKDLSWACGLEHPAPPPPTCSLHVAWLPRRRRLGSRRERFKETSGSCLALYDLTSRVTVSLPLPSRAHPDQGRERRGPWLQRSENMCGGNCGGHVWKIRSVTLLSLWPRKVHIKGALMSHLLSSLTSGRSVFTKLLFFTEDGSNRLSRSASREIMTLKEGVN